jgi:hypothetical protein
MLFMCWCPYIVSSLEFPGREVVKLFQNRGFRGGNLLIAWLRERAVRSLVALRKEGQVELLGRRLINLARTRCCRLLLTVLMQMFAVCSSQREPICTKGSEGFSMEVLGRRGLRYREAERQMFVASEVLIGPSGMTV